MEAITPGSAAAIPAIPIKILQPDSIEDSITDSRNFGAR